MDKADLLSRSIQAIEAAPQAPVDYAQQDLGAYLETPPRPLLEFCLIERGTWRITTLGRQAEARPGDVVIMNAHFGNRGQANGSRPTYHCVSVATDRLPGLQDLGSAPLLHVRPLPSTVRDDIERRFAVMIAEMRPIQRNFSDLRRKSALLQLLLGLHDAFGQVQGSQQASYGMGQEIMAWIARQPLDRPFRGAALTHAIGLGERHLIRLFTAIYHRTPRQQHVLLRLERARALLGHGALSVKEVAAVVGYTDPLHFSRRFAQAFGHPPSAVRDRQRVIPT